MRCAYFLEIQGLKSSDDESIVRDSGRDISAQSAVRRIRRAVKSMDSLVDPLRAFLVREYAPREADFDVGSVVESG